MRQEGAATPASEGAGGSRPFGFESRHTLLSALVEAAARHGRRRPAQVEDMRPGRYSYGDILKTTLALGRLACKVSAPGEHVGVLMPNLLPSAGLVIGLSAFGRVPCMLNYTAGAGAIQAACETARIRTVLTSRQFIEKAELGATVAALTGVQTLYLEDLRARFGLADKLWLMAYALWWPRLAVPRGDPEAPAVVLFTSGSEGRPKGVVLSHRAILANIAQIEAALEFGPGDKVFNALPIFHSFGLTAGTLLPLLTGMRLMLYLSPLHYKAIPELVREKRCSVLFGTNTFLQHYARHAGEDDFRSLRLVVAGAEKLAEPVRQAWRERFGLEILEGYGVTEAAPVISVNTPEDNRIGTVGRPLPGIQAQVLPVPGVAPGGELHVRGPNLMSGYYRYEHPAELEPPASSLGPGWYATGDVVETDADGFIRIVGRLKRFAKVGGEMVALDSVEAIARAASAQGQHAAMSVVDEARGECIVLYTTDASLSRERLAAAARDLGQPEIALPRRIHVLEAIPVLGSGKVDYMALKARRAEP